jgi:hypothetical protein
MKESLRSLRFTIRTFPTSSSHVSQLSPTEARLKDTFSGCHTCFSKENQVHNYMHAKIKFHAYSDI